MSQRALRKYGVEATIDFELYEIDGVDLRTDWTPAAADCEIMKDGGASTQCTNTAVDEGSTYSIVLTATEMEAARLVLKIVDAATKVLLDKIVIIETYGNALAQHAFDLDSALVTLTGAYDAAKTAAQAGDAMDLIADALDATSQATTAVNEITAALLVAVIEGTITLQQSLTLANAANAGKLNGGGTATNNIRDLADTINRMVVTVDANGNRSAITRSFSDL